MPRPSRAATAFLLAGALLLPALAQAAPITQTYAFAASVFVSTADSSTLGLPPVTGTVTVTFDTATSVTGQTTGIALEALSIPFDGTLAFTYVTSGDVLTISGTPLVPGNNDFFLALIGASTATPQLGTFSYVPAGLDTNAHIAIIRSAGVVPPAVATPEPASLALLGAGLVALAASRRRA